MPRRSIAALWALMVFVVPVTAAGADGRTITIQFENDRFVNTDRHHTHGTRVVFAASPTVPKWAREPLDLILDISGVPDALGRRCVCWTLRSPWRS